MIEDIFKNMPFFKAFLNAQNGRNFSYLIISEAFSASVVAKLFAQALLCKDMCGKCENCQKIALGSHPDVKIFPEKGRLLVEDSKKIVEESFVRPIFADKKVIIIQNLEDATEEAQNKLLKSLEEPNDSVTYILTTASPEKVLPTIRSRCIKIQIPPVKNSDIAPFLAGDEKTKTLALAIGDGQVAKTIELSKMENLADLVELAIGLVQDLSSSRQAVVWSKKLLDEKPNFALVMQILGLVIEDALALKTNKKAKIRLESEGEKLAKIAGELSVKCLVRLSELIVEAMRQLSYNVNFPLIVDNLVMNILEVKYLCK